MKIFYVPHEKKTGKPICIIGKPDNLESSKGVTKAWRDHDFVNSISGVGNITMEWIPTNKEEFGKSCVLTVENFQQKELIEEKNEVRNWFCKGNFKKEDLKNTPIVTSDSQGKNRQNKHKVVYQNVSFSLALNNAISKEKQSGASTILRVFEN